MKVIYKYELAGIIQMPKDSRILTVDMQAGKTFIWAFVETDNEPVEREFVVYGTGEHINNDAALSYIGTFQQLGGSLIWHIFEFFNRPQG